MQKHFIVFLENGRTILNEVDGLDINLNVLMSVKERWVILLYVNIIYILELPVLEQFDFNRPG